MSKKFASLSDFLRHYLLLVCALLLVACLTSFIESCESLGVPPTINLLNKRGKYKSYSSLKRSPYSEKKHKMSLSERAINSVVGSLISDAATMGLHWIYDQSDLSNRVHSSGVLSPAFFQPPSCPYYQYESGRLSPYGDELIPFLRSFASVKCFNNEDVSKENYEFFKSYSGRLNHVTKAFVENRDAGKAWEDCPIVDHQAQGIIKIALTVARYAGHPDLLERVEEVVNVIHKSEISVAASKLLALIQQRILLSGDTPEQAINWASRPELLSGPNLNEAAADIISFVTNDALLHEYSVYAIRINRVPLSDPSERFKRMGFFSRIVASLLKEKNLARAVEHLSAEDKTFQENLLNQISANSGAEWAQPVTAYDITINAVSAALGLSCALPGALLTSLYIARRSRHYREAVEANIFAGGDNCSRAIVIGGLFAAAADPEVSHIPVEWVEQTNSAVLAEISQLAASIVADNTKLA